MFFKVTDLSPVHLLIVFEYLISPRPKIKQKKSSVDSSVERVTLGDVWWDKTTEIRVCGSKDSYLLTDWTMLRFQPGHFLLQPLDLLSLWTHRHKDHEIHITNVYHQTQKCFEKETITRAKMVAQNKQSSEKMAALFCHNEKRRCVWAYVCVCVGFPCSALITSAVSNLFLSQQCWD